MNIRNFNNIAYKTYGRVKKGVNGELELWWPCSGIAFRTNAKTIGFHFDKYADDTYPGYLKITINEEIHLVKIDKSISGISFRLRRSLNTVEAIKISEPLASITLTLLETDPEDAFIEEISALPRKFLFIGDSITAGFGVLGKEDNPVFDPIDSDSMATYAYRLAKRFDADFMYQVYSGKGIVNDCNGSREAMNLREAFAYTTPNKEPFDFQTYIPDVVFINAGTNDSWGGVNKEEFIEKGLELLTKIRDVYPNAVIIYFYGAMDTALLPTVQAMVRQFQKDHDNVEFVPTTPIDIQKGEIGSVGHPSVKANIRFYEELVPVVEKYLK